MAIQLADPRTVYPQPPFSKQKKIDLPAKNEEMHPTPDHGESSYVGHGLLEGLAAVITGGDSGIGRAIAIAYAREGADVVVNYHSSQDDAMETVEWVKKAGRKGFALQVDVQEQSHCIRMIREAKDKLGRLDVLINNAAYQQTRDTVDEMDAEMFDRVFKTNIYGPFYLSKAALDYLPAGGSIINTVSIQGFDPTPMLLPYAATKSALISMTKSMAGLAIKQGVRVNAVAPGPVWTPLIPSTMPLEKVQNFGSDTAFERPAQPAELAAPYVWLASGGASYMTGEVIGVTGGKMPI